MKTKSKTLVEEMYIIDGGSIELEKSDLTYRRDAGTRVRVPTPFYLIKTGEGYVLFDTGWSPAIVPLLEAVGYKPEIEPKCLLPDCLEPIGVAPQDIKTVILSHMHVDHAGGLQFLPDAEIIVQQDEYNYAFHPHAFSGLVYIKSDFDFPSYNWRLIDGDQVIMPGLSVVMVPGHTPGLQALIVDLPETGPVILSSDSCNLTQNVQEDLIPGSVWDPTRALHSIKRLKTYSEVLGAQLFPNHDLELFNTTWKKAPDCYR